METSKNSLCQQDVVELFCMLESPDSRTVEDVKSLIHENLNGTRDVWLLHGLLDYYMAVQSNRVLDILVHVRQPHDKHLFDRMVDYLRRENSRYNCLLLLSHLIHHQPSWLFKITQHRLFQGLLNILKSETDPPSLMCSLFSIVSLLPMLPYRIGSFLGDLFEIFSRLVAYSIKQNSEIPEVYVLHLQVGVHALFHRLYGMFPCNFLSYLRSHYGGREYKEENIKIFTTTIRPMLERVRLHPLLVTACKDSEISQNRWKRLATHDIVSLCASVSLDNVEGTTEVLGFRNPNLNSLFGSITTSQSQDNSFQYPSYSSISSNVSVMDSNLESTETSASNQGYGIWTPSQECGLFTPSPTITTPTKFVEQSHEVHDDDSFSEISKFDDGSDASIAPNEVVNKVSSIEILSIDIIPSDETVGEAFEAKEDDLDKEVSALTCDSAFGTDTESVRIDTPFRCTTQNLTDKTIFSISNEINQSKEEDEDMCTQADFDDPEQADLKLEDFMKTVNRFRYLSQCGLSPEILKSAPRAALLRSSSCPNMIMNDTSMFLAEGTTQGSNIDSKIMIHSNENENSSSYLVTNSIWNTALADQSVNSVETSYDHLIPLALRPLSLTSEQSYHAASYRLFEQLSPHCSLSPTELLDRHIQLGAEAHTKQLSLIPLTSTKNADWTHFGGTPPPDVISMAQTQIQLLHNHVMFERHQREIHAERNRRLLGKAKRSRIQDENTVSLKDQVLTREKEKEDIRKELLLNEKLFLQLENKKKVAENKFVTFLRKHSQDNSNLIYSNKKLQGLLVSQRQENDSLRQDLQSIRSEVLDLQFEVELLHPEIDRCRKLDKENQWLAKENILLQEVNQRYNDKLKLLEEPKVLVTEIDLMKESSISEIKVLKEDLESKLVTIDILRSQLVSLEEEFADAKEKLKQQSFVIDQLRSTYNDEISARQERLLDFRMINHHLTSHILQLYSTSQNDHTEEDFNCEDVKVSEDLYSDIAKPIAINDDYNVICIDQQNINDNSFELSFDEQDIIGDLSNVFEVADESDHH